MDPSDVAAPPRRIDIVCPRDGGVLLWDDAGVTCARCGAEWERDGDVPVFDAAARKAAASAPPGAADDFEAGVDWRFLFPLGADSRVLVIGFGDDGFVDAIAPDVQAVGALSDDAERARILDSPGAGRRSNVVPVVSTSALIPFRDAVFDLIVLDPESLPDARKPRRERLRAVRRKLAAKGRLYLPVENRWGRFFPGGSGAAHPDHHGLGMGGWRKLLEAAGFGVVRFHAAFPDARRPRELVPLDDPTALEWWWKHHAEGAEEGRAAGVATKLARRVGLLARVVPHFAIVARKVGAR